MRQLKIGTSSVRGVVGSALTPEMTVDFSSAFGTWCDGGTVVIGRDTRQSSPMLRAAVLSGLLATGCRVIDLGIAPTPLISFATRHLQAVGAIAITGSHNSAEWNALKFLGPDGALLNAVNTEDLLDIYHAADFTRVAWDGLQGWAPAPDDLLDRYVEHLLAVLDVERIRAQRLRVAVDFDNGTGVEVTQRLLKALGCTLIPLNEDPGADFAHPPAPTVHNMRQLAALLRYLEVDFGAAMNIDGDRIGFVTNAGDPLEEELTFPLIAEYVLSRHPGSVVTNLSTSRMIDEVARVYGSRVQRTLIGEGPVIDRALAEGAVIAGEGSGGVAYLPAVFSFDGFLALGLVMEAIAVTGESLAALADRLPRFAMRKGIIAVPPEMVYQVLEGFREAFADYEIDQTEGVRITWPDGWLHIRASNTEPLLRVIVEANDPDRADALFDDVMARAHRMAFGHAG